MTEVLVIKLDWEPARRKQRHAQAEQARSDYARNCITYRPLKAPFCTEMQNFVQRYNPDWVPDDMRLQYGRPYNALLSRCRWTWTWAPYATRRRSSSYLDAPSLKPL